MKINIFLDRVFRQQLYYPSLGRCFFVLMFLLSSSSLAAQKEADYIEDIAKQLGGKTEITINSGRIDILTGQYAIEVEYANKWKNSIGQALWYGLQTDKTPGIILIVKSEYDYKYVIQLNSTIAHYGLQDSIKVWQYPNDFPSNSLFPPVQKRSIPPAASTTTFWLTTSSKTRHNASCRYYQKTRGRACESNEGNACKRCGG